MGKWIIVGCAAVTEDGFHSVAYNKYYVSSTVLLLFGFTLVRHLHIKHIVLTKYKDIPTSSKKHDFLKTAKKKFYGVLF